MQGKNNIFFTRPVILWILEGTRSINLMNMEGTRPPTGASPTQPYKCGQNVKVKVKNRVCGDGVGDVGATVLGRPQRRMAAGCLITLKITGERGRSPLRGHGTMYGLRYDVDFG